MAVTSIDIEQVVREVLAQLASSTIGISVEPRQPEPPREQPAIAVSAPKAESMAVPATDGEIVLTQRLVTLSALGDRFQGIRRLVVPPQAVVTPSVRDELRKRNIALVFRRAEANCSMGGQRLMLVVAGAYDPAALMGVLAAEKLQVETDRTDCLMAASDRLAAELAEDSTIGMLATGHPVSAICLTNRLAGIRAVLGFDAATIAADTTAIGANLLVVNPRAHGLAQLKQLVLQFVRAGHQCPEVFRKRLG